MLIDDDAHDGPLSQIGPLEFQHVRRTADEPLFNSLMEQHHYLGYEQPVGEHLKYLVWAQRAADRLSGVEFGAAAPGQPGPIHRLERRSAAAQHPLHRLQHALSDSAVGEGAAPGLAHPRPHGPPAVAGLGAALRPSDLFSGNFRRSGTVSRNLLPSGQLGAAGAHHGTGQRRSDESAEPVDQRGAGLSADTGGFASYCRDRSMKARVQRTPRWMSRSRNWKRCWSGPAGRWGKTAIRS